MFREVPSPWDGCAQSAASFIAYWEELGENAWKGAGLAIGKEITKEVIEYLNGREFMDLLP